jgi:hypothetical protein
MPIADEDALECTPTALLALFLQISLLERIICKQGVVPKVTTDATWELHDCMQQPP